MTSFLLSYFFSQGLQMEIGSESYSPGQSVFSLINAPVHGPCQINQRN